jgi:pimeloyl-ACP methyl ester carboxylesterase
VGSNFYGSEMIEQLATGLQQHGITAVRINTRGHDAVSTLKMTGGGRLQGAAYETVDDCRADVAAWVELLQSRGYQRIGLVGHSLGALKSLYAQAHEQFACVSTVVAISPPCLSYDRFRHAPNPTAFQASLAQAELLLREGDPELLFRATFPFPLLISPQTFMDKYGPGERYNMLKWGTAIDRPISFIFGQRELATDNLAFAGIVEDLQQLDWPRQPTWKIVAHANHNYSAQLEELCALVTTQLISSHT